MSSDGHESRVWRKNTVALAILWFIALNIGFLAARGTTAIFGRDLIGVALTILVWILATWFTLRTSRALAIELGWMHEQ